MIDWVQRRGQIKHQLYTLAMLTEMDKDIFKEMLDALNEVEPVVHCVDCKHSHRFPSFSDGKPKLFCGIHTVGNWCYAVSLNDYCSKGERKDEGEK